jgi:pimeloyl-ACP methyl ester carboxylesterase
MAVSAEDRLANSELESAGHTALAPPNPLRGVAFDASVVSDLVMAIDGPVVLVGHSYGGAVITQASAGLENVTGLVFLAAFGLEVGESCASVQQPFPPPLLAKTAAPTPTKRPGAAGGPDLYVQMWSWLSPVNEPRSQSW